MTQISNVTKPENTIVVQIPKSMERDVCDLEALIRIRKREYDGEKCRAITDLIDDIIVGLKDLIFEELIETDEKLIKLDKEQFQVSEECSQLYDLIKDYPDFMFGNVEEFPADMDAILNSDTKYLKLKDLYREAQEKELALIREIEIYSDELIEERIAEIMQHVKERI